MTTSKIQQMIDRLVRDAVQQGTPTTVLLSQDAYKEVLKAARHQAFRDCKPEPKKVGVVNSPAGALPIAVIRDGNSLEASLEIGVVWE